MNKKEHLDSVGRFSNRVENYVKYRPHYPEGIIDFLSRECGLTKDTVIADIGSGPGISSEHFVANGNRVLAVEPNDDMRNAAEKIYGSDKNFVSIKGTAEETNLEDNCCNMIIAGQAFHWFDKKKCRKEFQRILKPGGYVVLMWNLRGGFSGIMEDYEQLISKYGNDYVRLYKDDVNEDEIREFFHPSQMYTKPFVNFQELTYEGFEGRLLSSSYIPLHGEDHDLMIGELKKIYDDYSSNGKVKLEYETKLFYGHLE